MRDVGVIVAMLDLRLVLEPELFELGGGRTGVIPLGRAIGQLAVAAEDVAREEDEVFDEPCIKFATVL